MAEAFGLDRKVENYQGKRTIGFYSWDLDCLEDVISMALDDNDKYPDKFGIEYEAMKSLYNRITQLREQE
jgi:hypothetical protein